MIDFIPYYYVSRIDLELSNNILYKATKERTHKHGQRVKERPSHGTWEG